MNKILKKLVYFFIFLILTKASVVFCQNYDIDYCGIFSDDLDANMAKLTSDLYYTQLSETQDFQVTDRRSEFSPKDIETVSADSFTPEKRTFFAEINKKENSDRWQAVFHIVHENKSFSKTKEYDSFYKILMEPKDVLKSTLSDLIKNGGSSAEAAGKSFPAAPATKTTAVSTEFLSGTWKAEDGLNKVVIMKGGRGFVIFSNGASMNISIQLNSDSGNQKITITQNQRANASYFPELSRQQALEHAVDARPIEWTLSATDSNTLTGAKHTLVQVADDVVYADIPVTWTRIN